MTLLRRFCCRQNLRALFYQLPARLKTFAQSFKAVFESNIRGTLFSDLRSIDNELRDILDPDDAAQDLISGKSHHLSLDIYEALRRRDSGADRHAISLRAVDHDGARYKPHSSGPKDSHVVFRAPDNEDWRAGRVRDIFTQDGGSATTKKIWLAVDEYTSLSAEDQVLDPYRKFPIAGGRLFYADFEPGPRILALEDIICHSTMIKRQLPVLLRECVHILPLDKALRLQQRPR